MPPLDEVLLEGVPVAALAAGLTAAGLTVAVGAVGFDDAWAALRHLGPVVAWPHRSLSSRP